MEHKNIKNKSIRFIVFSFLTILAVLLVIYLNNKSASVSPYNEYTLQESGSMKESANDFWWLNSGGLAEINGGNIKTNFGSLPKNDRWRLLYAKNNSRDTEDGYYPQNIFRLVTREKFGSLSQSAYFNIEKINSSKSEYRNESNGVLLFNRYQDGDNLYYTGFRVDGDAVIKKKIDGKYYTLKEKNVFKSNKKYNRDSNPNLIPEKKWIGIKSEVVNIGKDTVRIKLYADLENNGQWELILETEDKNGEYGKMTFQKEGYAGIRTDFMDIAFKDYAVSELK